ncbi:DNA topoisomerase 2 [Blyttiomyces sp. JEL0837]|nr:DNA topoisomerase 2 [Blyttiomyces sp. JEL0837]
MYKEDDDVIELDSGSDDFYEPAPKKKAPAKKATSTTTTTKETKPKAPSAASKKKKEPLKETDDSMNVDDVPTSLPKEAPLSFPATSKGSSEGTKTVEEIYQKKSQLEHILLRPDTYIGSVEYLQGPMWVFENSQMVNRNISYVPGLYKIFDEILVNAADNKIRDPKMDTVRVNIDKEDNRISIYNNGRGIPIQVHATEGVYVPELIFGHLLTSSNYDDSEKKVTGGRNGYGAKLCNIFSTEFIVETGDSATGKKYKQVFSKNMSQKGEPIITNAKTEDFTRITFRPDLAKFNMTHLDDDIEALFHKRAYDLAGCVPGIKVYLNDVRLKVKNFKEYVDLYLASPGEDGSKKPPVIYERITDRWEVAFTVSDGQFQQISFVNSICTSKGGTHVSHVVDQIVGALSELAKKKEKKGTTALKPHLVKSQIGIYVNCLIENPTFDSQTKENMTLRQSAFGSKCSIGEDFMKKVSKSGVLENILAVAKFKSDQALKKTDGHKSSRISGISKLDDANNAGTRHGADCTLILTEGDSAKSLAVSGLSIVGRDNFGVFPLRGKLLNVREASPAQIMNNAEITALKQIVGLQQGKKYESVKDLRYGHIMIMTDQDHDGSHIKGLIINFLDHFWPSLLKIPGFLLEFITPIVRATPTAKNKRPIDFFTIPEYEKWKREHEEGKGYTIKYYKMEENEQQLIDMAFNKKKADDRKEWLRQFQPGTYMDHSIPEIPISDFINKELILFSIADNQRSIPSVADGMKPGHRKILYCCFKRNLKGEIKVTQLAGYVSEHSAYHHGEQSLQSTIVGMAQNFVGSNNLNVLEPRGQFGTRLQGGKDAASGRYIFTTLNPIARVLFNQEDDVLLKYLNDDGQDIEPEWYLPILPMLLVNGADGIGTGWSTTIPNYNPREIIDNLYHLMRGEPTEPMNPWFRGFGGTIEQIDKDKFKVTGTIRKVDDTTVEITELPVKMWTQTYKEMLESWMVCDEAKKQVAWVKDFKEYHSDSKVHFVVTLTEENMRLAEAEGLEKKFKLTTQVATSNLVCFDFEGRICKYESVDDILRDFYLVRLKYYGLRKEAVIKRLTFELTKLDNRVRFITEIIEGTLRIQNRKRADILADLRARNYFPVIKKKAGDNANNEGEGAEEESGAAESNGDFDYLLTMPLWSLSYEKVLQLSAERAAKKSEIEILMKKSPMDLWMKDLDEFLMHWTQYEAYMEDQESRKQKIKASAGSKPKKTIKKKVDKDADMDVDDDDFDYAPITKTKVKVESKKDVDLSSIKKELSALEAPSSSKVNAASEPAPAVEPVATTEKVKAPPKPRAPRVEKSASTESLNESSPKEPIVISESPVPVIPSVEATSVVVAAEPKKRVLGAKKTVAPGKAQAPVKVASAATARSTIPIAIASPSPKKPAINTTRSDIAASPLSKTATTKTTAAKGRAAVAVTASPVKPKVAPAAESPGVKRPTRGASKPVSYREPIVVDSEDEEDPIEDDASDEYQGESDD